MFSTRKAVVDFNCDWVVGFNFGVIVNRGGVTADRVGVADSRRSDDRLRKRREKETYETVWFANRYY